MCQLGQFPRAGRPELSLRCILSYLSPPDDDAARLEKKLQLDKRVSSCALAFASEFWIWELFDLILYTRCSLVSHTSGRFLIWTLLLHRGPCRRQLIYTGYTCLCLCMCMCCCSQLDARLLGKAGLKVAKLFVRHGVGQREQATRVDLGGG